LAKKYLSCSPVLIYPTQFDECKKIFIDEVRKVGDAKYFGEWDKYTGKPHGYGFLYNGDWLYECYFV